MTEMTDALVVQQSSKSPAVASLLCVFLGYFGVHRFYVGKIGTGVLQLLTFGGFGIWYLIDVVMIAFGEFKDAQGNKIAGGNRKGVALLLCYFLGFLGVHRFYVGKIGTGVLMLITFGGFGLWWLIDLVLICCDEFKDKEGASL